MKKSKTLICDIDGVLLKHKNQGLSGQMNSEPINGTIEKLNEWDAKGHNIILITGRRESLRNFTEKQLQSFGIFYDQLIMGVGGGDRIVINDKKPNKSDDTCFAINLTRNEGINDINL